MATLSKCFEARLPLAGCHRSGRQSWRSQCGRGCRRTTVSTGAVFQGLGYLVSRAVEDRTSNTLVPLISKGTAQLSCRRPVRPSSSRVQSFRNCGVGDHEGININDPLVQVRGIVGACNFGARLMYDRHAPADGKTDLPRGCFFRGSCQTQKRSGIEDLRHPMRNKARPPPSQNSGGPKADLNRAKPLQIGVSHDSKKQVGWDATRLLLVGYPGDQSVAGCNVPGQH